MQDAGWLLTSGRSGLIRNMLTTLNIARCTCFLLLAIVFCASCTQQKSGGTKNFYNVDSLVTQQIKSLKGHKLNKSVRIGDKKDSASFAPDTMQWANELDIFRQLDQVNKASFSDAYVVTESRDIKSNLTVREIKANRLVPVTLLRLYYLRTPADLRKIEAMWAEENTLYINDRKLTIELDRIMHKYRIEGFQKMVMNDSVKFLIEGEVK
jgi:hypothetical protein